MAGLFSYIKGKRTVFLLLVIILLGTFLRLYQLDKFPPSLFGDEVDVGYQAYSILKTGKDYLGQPWPISFHSLADWRTPLFLYSDVPFIAIFGMNEWGVRLPAAIFGILTIPMFFLLLRKMFKNDNLALLGTFFLSISMWHLQYSRAAFEVTQMLFLFILGLYFFFKGLENWKYFFASAVFLALTPYSYNTAKFFLPLLLIILALSFLKEIKKIPLKRLILVGLVFAFVSLPMAKDIFFGQAGNRFSVLSIFTDPTVIPQVGFDRQVDEGVIQGSTGVVAASLSSRIFHNKFVYWVLALNQNYFSAFSTEFLFTRGDIIFRHSIQGGFGEFYWLDAILLVIGLVFLFKDKNKEMRNFILLWLFLSPIASVLTRDGGNHATRLILMLPPALIIITLGAYQLFILFKRNKLKPFLFASFGLVIFMQFSLYLHRYYVHYPLESEQWWHFGYKQLAQFAKQNENNFDYIIWSDKDQPPLIFSLFWLKIDPKIVQNNKLKWVKLSDAIMADNLPGTKYYFGHVSEERVKANGFVGTLKPNMLYLTPKLEIGKDFRNEPVPNSLKLLQTIYYPSGAVSHYVITGL